MSFHLLNDTKVLITAGPTKEAIDPVRFISNHSSGKMGYAIAEEFLDRGAQVTLISGPVCLSLSHPNLKLIAVESAMEMYMACCLHFEESDIIVFSAAVADYRPAGVMERKIKSNSDKLRIELVKNIDIAAELGKHKKADQVTVGFALETHNETEHAIRKLKRKNLDLVVLNSMNDAQATFGYNTNKITTISSSLVKTDYPLKSKKEVARDIVKEVQGIFSRKQLVEILHVA